MTDRSAPPTGLVPGGLANTFRVFAVLTTVLIFIQPVLAGLFITGNVTMLSIHSANATLIQLLTIPLLIMAILIWRPGRGSPRLMWVSFALFVLVGAQAGFGYTRSLAFHIPLGVFLFAFSVQVLLAAFKPMHRVTRPVAAAPDAPLVAEEPAP